MDTAVRDLEQIQERNDEQKGQRYGLLALGGLATVGLVFAMGAALSDSRPAEAVQLQDPLARLASSEGLAPSEARTEPAPITREDLTFPNTLVDDPRPEVAAAMAAASAEAQHPFPIDDISIPQAGQSPAALPEAPSAATRVSAALPAAVAAGPAARIIAQSAHSDPLLSNIPDRSASAAAPVGVGAEGTYTVQVISYDHVDEANAFAAALRTRGHHAFVMRVDVPGRGRVFRVRIGPFDTLREAETYRHDFEARERMNTLVVRRATDARSAAE
ncbi:MAG: SPOR domain-containing protein [Sandaracinaceae bacterium]|nr:SPOR domain-containing protein [Sandaracinaceae bacterium]